MKAIGKLRGGGEALKTVEACRKSEYKKGGVKNNKNKQELSKNVSTNGIRLYIKTWSQFINKIIP